MTAARKTPGRPKGLPKRGGRRKGVGNKRTRARVESVEVSGLTPLDFLLETMRNPKNPRAVRLDAACRAAPYVHPQIAPIDIAAARLLGQLLTEIVNFHAGPAKQ